MSTVIFPSQFEIGTVSTKMARGPNVGATVMKNIGEFCSQDE